jgi:hypothetical protein
MSTPDKSTPWFRSIVRALARALSRLDGSVPTDSTSNSTFDMRRIDERIAELKAKGTRSPEKTAPAPSVQPFGKRRTHS